ncbi:LacI family DNA-binding transcriptional regulator [Robbsia sp. Bb-Pol-6]|uniref:LacI family DNA-binding transcriptional regulator n=1 Tax=Robbsia betulipollinis TaxID=2981849 RepID=A0ABT3ZR70_9BURK|nr:LacI family DNA-binding transcriptional regulator [Robbsia betulipollinis]MCY0389048.1 LacI family DNA-binding transcriptional regulator [Robbsia betulipollinis]
MALRIKDVAQAAGVSVTTVSRVLSNNGPVRDSVRERVQAAMQELGYRPNAAARRLRSGDTATIGLVVSDVRNPFFTEVSRAVEDMAYRQGMRVILCNTDENPEKEAMYLRLMEEERVTGMIYSPTRDAAERFRAEHYPFPVVMIDRADAASHADAVTLDNRAAAERLTLHLLERGHRCIFGLFGNASTTGRERHAGYCDAMQRHGLGADAVFVEPQPAGAQQAVGARLAARGGAPVPDAILASNGLLLLGAFRALREARQTPAPGLHGAPGHPPAAPALCGFDNDAWTELVEPGITVIAQPVYEIGRCAMTLLSERIAQPDIPRRTRVLPGELIVRGSSTGIVA